MVKSDILEKIKGRVELWQGIISKNKIKTVAEIGVWRGDFAACILMLCPTVESYTMIDPWRNLPDWNKPNNRSDEEFASIYTEAMAKTAFAANRRRVLRGTTVEVVDKIKDSSLDFVYVDGDHTLKGISLDMINILPKVKTGGFIGGDDFVENHWHHGRDFAPTMVKPFILSFAEAYGFPLHELPCNQFLLQKNAP